jgi:predicted nucleotidyltransferase component of viral defense system
MYNYSKSFLDKMAVETGFIRDNLEKVFRLCDILQFLNTHPTTCGCLALKGGTAINLTIFNLPRLSVDIDLDFCRECSRDEMMRERATINEDILNYMFAQGYALSPNTKNPHSLDSWVFYFQNAGGNRDNVKIEINYSMRHHVLPVVKKRVKVDFLQFPCELTTLSPLELFGGKIKALIERTAPRDLYDVHNMVIENIIHPEEQDLLRKIVLFYLVLGSSTKLALPVKLDNLDAMKFSQIRAHLLPVLKKREKFDAETAKAVVGTYLSQLMTLTDKEISFVENFYRGVYQPDLLFDDVEIIERIREHPFVVWKMKNQSTNS